jgi:hypothetical protein
MLSCANAAQCPDAVPRAVATTSSHVLLHGVSPHRSPRDEPEFAYIEARAAARHVYVLDVAARMWERVATSGASPSWRSLHVGLACKSVTSAAAASADALKSASEGLLILGGSDEHVMPFSSGPCADFAPYVLDLSTFVWRTPDNDGRAHSASEEEDEQDEAPDVSAADAGGAGGAGGAGSTEQRAFRPRPRMRFAAEAYGRHGNAAWPRAHHMRARSTQEVVPCTPTHLAR